MSPNRDAGGWAGGAFNLGIHAYLIAQNNTEGRGFAIPFTPKISNAGGEKITVFGEGSLVRKMGAGDNWNNINWIGGLENTYGNLKKAGKGINYAVGGSGSHKTLEN